MPRECECAVLRGAKLKTARAALCIVCIVLQGEDMSEDFSLNEHLKAKCCDTWLSKPISASAIPHPSSPRRARRDVGNESRRCVCAQLPRVQKQKHNSLPLWPPERARP